MLRLLFKNTAFLLLLVLISCANGRGNDSAFTTSPVPNGTVGQEAESAEPKNETQDQRVDSLDIPHKSSTKSQQQITVGANQTEAYLPLLVDKRVGIITNQSGLIFKSFPHTKEQSTHLIDSLLSLNINIKKVYSPEHGFRGDKDAGEKVTDGKDPKTGLTIISLHGKSRKPSTEQLNGIDILVFDIQDVGVRFYTYISTLTNVLEAAAEKVLPVIVLDRPNPNAHYIDGPVLEKEHSSFLGMHEVPLVYGMTIGEYARMVNGEQWMNNRVQADLTIIPLQHWNYNSIYSLPTRPSPNLPNDVSINLYPSLGFFEGTSVNAGRGTEMQFQIFGAPDFDAALFPLEYTPEANFGASNPKFKGDLCHGKDLRETPYMSHVSLEWLIEAYVASKDKSTFFKTASFTLHAGNENIQQQIEEGYTFKKIKASWHEDIERFKRIRAKYLLYE